MKKLISSVLIFSLMLTLFASAMPDNRNNSAIMDDGQMIIIVGGINWYCVGAIVGAGVMVAGLFSNPVTAGAVGLYAANAILGPTIAGTGILGSCISGGGGDKEDSKPSHYRFERVN